MGGRVAHHELRSRLRARPAARPPARCLRCALCSYAVTRKHDKIIAFLDNPKAPVAEEEGEEEEEKPKARVFKASQQVGVSVETKKQEEAHAAKVAAAEALEAELKAAPKPAWPEVAAVLAETR